MHNPPRKDDTLQPLPLRERNDYPLSYKTRQNEKDNRPSTDRHSIGLKRLQQRLNALTTLKWIAKGRSRLTITQQRLRNLDTSQVRKDTKNNYHLIVPKLALDDYRPPHSWRRDHHEDRVAKMLSETCHLNDMVRQQPLFTTINRVICNSTTRASVTLHLASRALAREQQLQRIVCKRSPQPSR